MEMKLTGKSILTNTTADIEGTDDTIGQIINLIERTIPEVEGYEGDEKWKSGIQTGLKIAISYIKGYMGRE